MATEARTPSPAGPFAMLERGGRCPCCGKVVSSPRGDRRFAIIDAMILIAASAVAFVLVRPLIFGTLQTQPPWARYLVAAVGVLVTWTPTVFVLRLRRPRPTLHRLSRQPGFAAGLAGTAILFLGALTIGVLALIRESRGGIAVRPGVRLPSPDPAWWSGVVIHFGTVVGPAIIGVWLLLALSGRRRPTLSWLDLLGRAMGTAWIVLFVINCGFRLSYLVKI